MSSLRKKIKKVLEAVSGYKIRRFESNTLFLTAKDYANESQRDSLFKILAEMEFKSVLEKYEIDHVLDVGANRGQFAKFLRDALGYEGRIISFEPVSSIFQELTEAARDDPRWDVYNLALGSRNTDQKIYISERSQFSSFLKSTEYCETHFGERTKENREEAVKVRRLDEMLEEIVDDLDSAKIFLKLDTQGYDLEVFAGLGDKCKSVAALMSEISIIPLYEEMPDWKEGLSCFQRAGFEIAGLFPVTRDSLRIVEYDVVMVNAGLQRHPDTGQNRERTSSKQKE